MKVLLCVLLVVLPGCAGILTARDAAPAVPAAAPMPPGWAYAMTIEFLDTPSTAPLTAEQQKLLGLDVQTKDTAFGITAALSKLPLVGWMFAASKVADIAQGGIGGTSGGGPVTDGVFKAAIASGRVKSIRWIPVKADEVVKAPEVAKEVE